MNIDYEAILYNQYGELMFKSDDIFVYTETVLTMRANINGVRLSALPDNYDLQRSVLNDLLTVRTIDKRTKSVKDYTVKEFTYSQSLDESLVGDITMEFRLEEI